MVDVAVLRVPVQLEVVPEDVADVAAWVHLLQQELLQAQQLAVVMAVVVRNDGHSVLHLEVVRVGGIVHQKDILQVAVLNDPEVLDVDALIGEVAVLSEEALADVLVLRIQKV